MLHNHAPATGVKISLPRALPKATRAKVEAAIEQHLDAADALRAFLDVADGDPDDEPSLGAVELSEYISQDRWADRASDGREYDPADPPRTEGLDENELDGPEHPDDEYELGWPEQINQTNATDVTADMGGGQFVVFGDGEPWLSGLEQVDQRQWSAGDHRELEQQCEDEGAQCDDEGVRAAR